MGQLHREVHLFDEEEYTTKRDKTATENRDRNEWKRSAVHVGLLPVLGKLLFRRRVQEAVNKE